MFFKECTFFMGINMNMEIAGRGKDWMRKSRKLKTKVGLIPYFTALMSINMVNSAFIH